MTAISAPQEDHIVYQPMIRSESGGWVKDDRAYPDVESALRHAAATRRQGAMTRVEEHAYDRRGRMVQRKVVRGPLHPSTRRRYHQ